MKSKKPTGKPKRKLQAWRLVDLAAVMETSIESVVAAARICAMPILPGGVVYLPCTPSGRHDFFSEGHRADMALKAMEERKRARLSAD